MMKYVFTVCLLVLGAVSFTYAQEATLEELKTKQAELKGQLDEATGQVDALSGELSGIEQQIKYLSGWDTGLNGLVGFTLGKSNDWIASPNPNSSSTGLNIGLTAYANNEKPKTFWRNKLVANMAWNDVDLSEADDTLSGDGLFDNGTVDILNLSSLYGYKLNDWIALSALGEANTSVGNFFQPGTIDIGLGATLTPIQNLVVVIHPLNYHIAFSADKNIESQGSLGAKFRADYTRDFMVTAKKISWSSTLTGFIPYGDKVELVEGDPSTEVSLFNYTWLNTLSFEVWKGIGVGVSAGIRNSELEFDGTQSFYSLGLTYGF